MGLEFVCTRGGRVESSSRVQVAVVDVDGTVVASAGDVEKCTWWRSAAKPFQAAVCVRDGAADRYRFGEAELAVACASHSSEEIHVHTVRGMLSACGCVEDDLACGGHPPLSPRVHDTLVRDGRAPTPLHSNCSGKHAAMLALARHHAAEVRGYEHHDHVVQRRVLDEVLHATGLARSDVELAGDGCRAVTFYLPLRTMARAWARFGSVDDSAWTRLRGAMLARPELVAGTDRSCTLLMQAAGDALVVKVGAEGVYCAALPTRGLGIALKVESGDWRATPVALCAVLAGLDEKFGLGLPHEAWSGMARPAVRDTRGDVVGELMVQGTLAFA